MPILDDGGKYIPGKGKRVTADQAIEVKPLQLKIFFLFKRSKGVLYGKL